MTAETPSSARTDAPALIAPFATWMMLMLVLPSATWSYVVRTAMTALVLVWSWRRRFAPHGPRHSMHAVLSPVTILLGLFVGLLVLFFWVWPEKTFGWYRAYCMYGYTANASVDSCGWAMKAVRLFGSAFVISVAEELFFRKWLVRYAGFLWMVGLFAVQHNRWLAAAVTGALYGWLALRKGVVSAIIAHMVTNLGLGIYVLVTDDWVFW